jgi:hypothetical protein
MWPFFVVLLEPLFCLLTHFVQSLKHEHVETLVVLDDLPRVRIGDLLFDRVLESLKQSTSTKVRFFSTSPFSLPNQLKKVSEGSLFIEETPRFSTNICSNLRGELQGIHLGCPSSLCAYGVPS